ncbi:MAG: DUF4252 domain-containing protein, partial [Bacteroidota bacterium]
PGYFDFEEFADLKNVEIINEVDLEEPMLKMIGKMFEDKKKEPLVEKITSLKLVRVREFNIDKKDFDSIESATELMDKNLQSKKWDRIIRTKGKKSFTNVYVKKGSDEEYVGLVVISLDMIGRVTFVNIVGNIDFEAIGKMSGVNIPQINKLKNKEEKKKQDQ